MPPLPDHRPKQLSLGSLETEILSLLWELHSATVKDLHDRILSNPDRELAQASITTVLNRLQQKGWVRRSKQERAFLWEATISKEEADALQAHAQLKQFLEISSPEVVAAFADSLDVASLDKLEAIAARLRAVRQSREEA